VCLYGHSSVLHILFYVFLLCLSSSCVPYVDSFSGLSFWLPLRYSLTCIRLLHATKDFKIVFAFDLLTEYTYWWLFQNHAVRTKWDIYIFNMFHLELHLNTLLRHRHYFPQFLINLSKMHSTLYYFPFENVVNVLLFIIHLYDVLYSLYLIIHAELITYFYCIALQGTRWCIDWTQALRLFSIFQPYRVDLV
jgi:hypothetical protein